MTPHQRRIARYLERHPGASLQEARGHHPREHVTRAESRRRAGALTEVEKAAINRFADKQAKRMDRKPADARRELRSWVERAPGGVGAGMARFQELKARVKRNEAAKRVRVRKWVRETRGRKIVRFRIEMTGRSERRDEMDDWADDWGLDWEWFFYH